MSESFFVRRRFLIALVMFFSLPFILMGTRRALRSNRNDVRDWLPAHHQETADHRWFQEHFPHEQFVLCSWDGCTLDEDDPRLELLARKLVPSQTPKPEAEDDADNAASPETVAPIPEPPPGPSRFFKSVLTGPRLVKELQDRYPSLSREDVIERLKGSLIGPGGEKTCLVVTLSDEAKGKNLRAVLEQIRQYARECSIEPPLLEDHRNVLFKAGDKVIGVIGEMLFGQKPPGKGIRMGGPPVDNVAIDVEGERTLMRLAGLSALVGLGISMACLRSWRLTILVFWTAILAAGIGLAVIFWTKFVAHSMLGWVPEDWTWGSVDAIMLSMPTLVYVLAISGAIHITNYYHDAIRENGLLRAPEQALAHGWLPCTLAALTTAIGLGSLFLSHVVPISKFGLYAAVAVMATLVLMFLLLPALLSYFPSRKYNELHGGGRRGKAVVGDASTETAITRWWRMAGGFVIRRNTAVSVGCMAVMLFFLVPLVFTMPGLKDAGLPHIRTSVKLMKFFSPDAEIIHHYRWLEKHLGPLVPMEVVLKIDNEKCDLSFVERMRLAHEVEETIEEKLKDDVGGALSAATFAPDISPSTRRPSLAERMLGLTRKEQRRIRDKQLSERLEQHREEFREYLAVDAEATLDQLGISGELASRLEAEELTTLTQIEAHAKPQAIAAGLAAIKGVGADEAARVEEAIGRWKTEHGQELWRISARVDALSDLDYAVFVDDLRVVVEEVLHKKRQELGFRDDEGIVAVYTGLVPLVYQTQHELMRGLFNSLATAFVLIAFVMMLVLKSPSAGLLAMIPNIFPVVIIFGIMGWLGVLVDVGSMMTASVALGVAVDDTMHYLTWFRRGLDQGRDRKGAAMMAYERCATAMTQTTLIGGLGLAAFSFSTFTPTQRFGTLMLVLLFAALMGDLIFLPALLTGPLGRVFGPRKKKPRPDAPTDGPLPEETAKRPDEGAEHSEKAAEDDEAAAASPSKATTLHLRRDIPHRARRTT